MNRQQTDTASSINRTNHGESLRQGVRIFAVDVGGTHMRIAEAADQGLCQIEKYPTPQTPERFVQTIAEATCNRLVEAQQQSIAIGIASAGIVDTGRGEVVGSVGNVPALQQAPALKANLLQVFPKEFSPFILIENDANAAAYAEAKVGAGRGKSDVVLIILGTGVGAGIVKDGKLFSSRYFSSGEIGHTVITQTPDRDCTLCGNSGCLESYASGPGLLKTAQNWLTHHAPQAADSALLKSTDNIEAISTYDLVRAWQEGDRSAGEIKMQWHRDIAVGVHNLIRTLDPEIIVLGGGMSQVVDYPLLNQLVRQITRLPVPDDLAIVPAQLGDEAGMIGATLLVRDALAAGY